MASININRILKKKERKSSLIFTDTTFLPLKMIAKREEKKFS